MFKLKSRAAVIVAFNLCVFLIAPTIYIFVLVLFFGLKLAWISLGVLYSKYMADDEPYDDENADNVA